MADDPREFVPTRARRAVGYSDAEKKYAKRLKKLFVEETGAKVYTHSECLEIVRRYKGRRDGRAPEAFVAFIFDDLTDDEPGGAP